MNTIKIILVLILLNVVVQTFGQQVFYTTVDSINYEVSPAAILENSDSTIVVAGRISGSQSNGDLFVAKLSSVGIQLWLKYIPTPKGEYNAAMVHGIDSGYLLSATSYSYPIFAGDNDSTKDILIIKVNNRGNEEWRKVLPAYDHYAATVSPDSSYIIYGEWFNDWAERSRGNLNDFIIYKLDKRGNIIWRKIIGTKSNDYKFDNAFNGTVYCDENSNIYFTGETDSGATNYLHGLLYKLDSNGNLIYRKFFEENKIKNESICPHQIFELNGKHYYNRAHEIYEFDLMTGNEKKITDFKSGSNPFKNLANIAVKGNNISATFERDFNNEDNEMQIARLDALFNPYWRKIVSVPKGARAELIPIQSLSSISNGNLFLFHEKDSNENDYGRVIKTDCNGNYDVWRACTVGVNEINISSSKLKVFPNPTKGKTYIKINISEAGIRIEIRDIQGRLMYSEIASNLSNDGMVEISVSDFPSGMYLIKVFSNKFSESIKLIKE